MLLEALDTSTGCHDMIYVGDLNICVREMAVFEGDGINYKSCLWPLTLQSY